MNNSIKRLVRVLILIALGYGYIYVASIAGAKRAGTQQPTEKATKIKS